MVNLGTKVIGKSLKVLLGEKSSQSVQSRMVQELAPTVTEFTKYGDIKFFCPALEPYNRAKTLLTKEPETIQWIDSMHPGEVLWDIGACVGCYSLYPALKGVTVIAFEPSPGNYYLLSKNIEINALDLFIEAYNIAFTNTTGLGIFYMSDTELGSAGHNFGVDGNDTRVALGTIGYTIDYFIEQFKPPFPQYIKIDVDGIEDRIIEGASETLKDSRLESILIEVDTSKSYYRVMCSKLKDLRFRKVEIYPITSTISNHIFTR